MRALILAEKPSVARDIARVLGCRTAGDGCITGEKYIVTWAIGHLVSLCEPDELDPAYKKWRMEQLPMLPQQLKTRVLPKTRAQFQVVKKLMTDKTVERIICATDSGREGELIFRYIYAMADCHKPVERLWISSMTDAAIREGFARLRPAAHYDPLYVSARCRAEADWLVGMNATRAFTLKYGVLLSLGRVQTPTLKLIVERDLEIQRFVPEDYHEIRADFGDYEGLWLDPEKRDARCRDAQFAARVRRETEGQSGVVTESRREQKRTPPPQLFDLTALQREANRLMGLSAAKTLSAAQALYETHKLITYPRTDSRYLPRDMIPKIAQVLGKLPQAYEAFVEPVRSKPPVPPRMYNDAKVSDHHAIVPTGHATNFGRLSDVERRVYDMIVRRLIAALYPDYEYESALVLTQVGEHTFRTTGQTPLREGWKALYRGDKVQDSKEEPKVPLLAPGETRIAQKVTLKKCKTKPPSPHTDASLLGMMENAGRALEDESLKESMKDSGLGTPATRASVIERLIQVGFIARKGKALFATEKGIRLIQVAPAELSSPEMTGKWERSLSRMTKETDQSLLDLRSGRFMESIRRFSAFLVEAARGADESVQFEKEAPRGKRQSGVASLKCKCPLCGEGEVTGNAKAFGCSRWRDGCGFTIWRDALCARGGANLSVKDMKALLGGGTVPCGSNAARLDGAKLIILPGDGA